MERGKPVDDVLNATRTDPMESYFDIMELIVVIAAIAGLIALIVWAILVIHQAILRSKVGKEYSVSVPSSVKVKKTRQYSRIGAFRMGYPSWEASKKDGTRDRRTNNLRIIKNPTVILIGQWRLNGQNPFEAYALVKALRQAGHAVGYCRESNISASSSWAKCRHSVKPQALTASSPSSRILRVISNRFALTCSTRLAGGLKPLLPFAMAASI